MGKCEHYYKRRLLLVADGTFMSITFNSLKELTRSLLKVMWTFDYNFQSKYHISSKDLMVYYTIPCFENVIEKTPDYYFTTFLAVSAFLEYKYPRNIFQEKIWEINTRCIHEMNFGSLRIIKLSPKKVISFSKNWKAGTDFIFIFYTILVSISDSHILLGKIIFSPEI